MLCENEKRGIERNRACFALADRILAAWLVGFPVFTATFPVFTRFWPRGGTTFGARWRFAARILAGVFARDAAVFRGVLRVCFAAFHRLSGLAGFGLAGALARKRARVFNFRRGFPDQENRVGN